MTAYQADTHNGSRDKGDVIASLRRGLRVLELLATAPEGLLAKTISARTGLNLSTCYHLLNTLIAAGYVFKPEGSQLFCLSGKVAYPRLPTAEGLQLVPYLLPHLQALHEQTHESVYLSIRDGSRIVLSEILDAPQTLRLEQLPVGAEAFNHATALGKAILAHVDAYTVVEHLDQYGMDALTTNTITSSAALTAELAAVRERGYSLDREEFAPGVCCIAAPIFNAAGRVVAAFGIPLDAARAARSSGLAQIVQARAVDATRALTMTQLFGDAST